MSGLTSTGFIPRTRAEIQTALLDRVEAELGASQPGALPLDRSAGSAISRLCELLAGPIADGWAMADRVWASIDPAQAEGVPLDHLASVTGIARLGATRSTALTLFAGKAGTLLPAGRAVSAPSGARFVSREAVVLSSPLARARVRFLKVAIGALYRVTVEGVTHEVAAVEADSAATLAQRLATAVAGAHPTRVVSADGRGGLEILSTEPGVASPVAVSAVVRTAWQLRMDAVLANTAYQLTFAAQLAGPFASPATAPMGAVASPGSVVTNLVGQINLQAVGGRQAMEVGDGLSLTVEALAPGQPFYVRSSSSNLAGVVTPHFSMREVTPLPADLIQVEEAPLAGALLWLHAEQVGPVAAAARALSRIETPVSGWERALNLRDADLGREMETDAELRARRGRSLQVPGVGTRESIEARLQQAVPGVRAVRVFENDLDVADGANRPPHSFEVVLDAPADPATDRAAATLIWRLKAAGIAAVSTAAAPPARVEVEITDSMGQRHLIAFSRPEALRVMLDIQLKLLPEETFPPGGEGVVAERVLTAAQRLSIGEDVVLSRFLREIYSVPGISTVVIDAEVPGAPGAPPLAQARWDNLNATSTNLAISAIQRSTFEAADIVVRVIP